MDRRPAAPWAPSAVVLLTVAWLLGALVLLRWWFDISVEFWPDSDSTQDAGADQRAHRSNTALLLLAAEVVAGPVVIAVVAVCGRLRRTAAVYLVIAFGLCFLAVPVAAEAYRDLNPPSSPPPAPTMCQQRSGDDASCPGG